MALLRFFHRHGPVLAIALVLLLLSAGLRAQQPAASSRPVAPKQLQEGASCITRECHGNLAKGASVHRPVARKSCDACHEQDDETLHEFTYPDTGSELCYSCHSDMTTKKKTKKKMKIIHAPLKDAKRPCLTCHTPHASETKHLIAAKSTTAKCLQCHAEKGKGTRLHKSPAAGGCTGCHLPHAGDSPRLLKFSQPKLCYSCHEGIGEDIAEAKVVHGPVSVSCTVCHDPHKARVGQGLKKSGAELCMTCHTQFKDKFKSMTARHPQLREKRDCLRCHLPHSAQRKCLLAATPQTLCMKCHKGDIKARDGELVKSPADEMVKGAKLHGPLKSRNCAACHEPHGNSRARFVRRAYPATLYSPYKVTAYALCFGCHDSSLAADSRTSVATKFRDGSENLHYVHVNKPRKGRSCQACHAAHASRNPHMIADSVAFGLWKLPINFHQAKDGGTCAPGCHAAKTYSRSRVRATGKPSSPAESPTTRPGS